MIQRGLVFLAEVCLRTHMHAHREPETGVRTFTALCFKLSPSSFPFNLSDLYSPSVKIRKLVQVTCVHRDCCANTEESKMVENEICL